jgi:site-specific DNA-methyltransferase (adenine-specific)
MEINKVYNEDCLVTMGKMPKEFIDLTITSPPYDNLRNYNGYSFDFESIAKELYRITKKGGVIVWVVSDATINGSESGTSFRQALYFKEIGFNIHDTMIWRKPNAPPQTKEGRRYTLAHEYMFVFSKGRINTFNPIMVACVNAGKKSGVGTNLRPDGTLRIDRINARKGKVINNTKQLYSVWDCSINTKNIGHPAAFPEKLVNDHIITWSNEGDLVYDCFMGSGTTAKVSILNNRRWIGSEISSEYCDIINKRISDIPKTLF